MAKLKISNPIKKVVDERISKRFNTSYPVKKSVPCGGGHAWSSISPLTVKGGVPNGDFALQPTFVAAQVTSGKWLDGTAAGNANNLGYGWYFINGAGTTNVRFDNATGNEIVITAPDITSRGRIMTAPFESTTTAELISKYGIPAIANTAYTANILCKTITSPDSRIQIQEYKSDGTLTTTNSSNVLTGDNDYTLLTKTFTTAATTAFLVVRLVMNAAGTAGSNRYKKHPTLPLLAQTTSITNSSSSPALFYPTLTANSSTDNIDQSQTTTGGTEFIGGGVAVNRKIAQQILPTKKNFVSFVVNKGTTNGTPTGDLIFELFANNSGVPDTTVLATKTYTRAVWDAISNGEVTVPLTPTNPLTIGASTTYWVTIRDSVTESLNNYYLLVSATTNVYTSGVLAYSDNGGAWSNQTRDLYFKTLYSKNTTNLTVSTDTQQISVTAPTVDGWANGTVIDVCQVGNQTPLTLASGVNNIYVSSNGPSTADGTVDPSLQATLGGSYVA